MHVVIRRYEVPDPSTASELVRELNEGFVPIISEVPGFVSYYAMFEREPAGPNGFGGRVLLCTVSVFETSRGAQQSTRTAAEYVRQKLRPLLPGDPEVQEGAAIIHRAREVVGS